MCKPGKEDAALIIWQGQKGSSCSAGRQRQKPNMIVNESAGEKPINAAGVESSDELIFRAGSFFSSITGFIYFYIYTHIHMHFIYFLFFTDLHTI